MTFNSYLRILLSNNLGNFNGDIFARMKLHISFEFIYQISTPIFFLPIKIILCAHIHFPPVIQSSFYWHHQKFSISPLWRISSRVLILSWASIFFRVLTITVFMETGLYLPGKSLIVLFLQVSRSSPNIYSG